MYYRTLDHFSSVVFWQEVVPSRYVWLRRLALGLGNLVCLHLRICAPSCGHCCPFGSETWNQSYVLDYIRTRLVAHQPEWFVERFFPKTFWGFDRHDARTTCVFALEVFWGGRWGGLLGLTQNRRSTRHTGSTEFRPGGRVRPGAKGTTWVVHHVSTHVWWPSD